MSTRPWPPPPLLVRPPPGGGNPIPHSPSASPPPLPSSPAIPGAAVPATLLAPPTVDTVAPAALPLSPACDCDLAVDGCGGDELGCVVLLLGGVCSLAVSGLGDSWPTQLSGPPPPPVEPDHGDGGHPAGDTPPPQGRTGAGESCRIVVVVVAVVAVVVPLLLLVAVDDGEADDAGAVLLPPGIVPRIWFHKYTPTSRLLQRMASLSENRVLRLIRTRARGDGGGQCGFIARQRPEGCRKHQRKEDLSQRK